MPAAFAELQGDYLYMLTTPSRQEMDQMIADFGQRQEYQNYGLKGNDLLNPFVFLRNKIAFSYILLENLLLKDIKLIE